MQNRLWIVVVAITLGLTGCGGGSGDTLGPIDSPPVTTSTTTSTQESPDNTNTPPNTDIEDSSDDTDAIDNPEELSDSSDSTDALDTEDNLGPEDTSDTADTVDSTDNTDTTEPTEPTDTTPAVESLAAGQTRSGSVDIDTFDLYRVPSGAEVILTTESGDANLALYTSSEVFSPDTFLCFDGQAFIEDNCSATNPNGDVFAAVFADEASNYNIRISADCSVPAINDWVYRSMQDYYLFADNVPVVDPSEYSSPNALLSDIRFQELDPFSGVNPNQESREQLFAEGMTFGFGHSFRVDANGAARIASVYADSPFGRAGVKRGDISLGINDELWNDIDNDRFDELVGDDENPLAVTWQFIDGETGERKSPLIQAAEYRLNTVLFDTVYTNPSFDGATGYIVFNSFLRTSEAELDAAIERIRDGGATELVLDLRYNGGGFTFIANKLASQIGGADLDGNLLVRYEYNDQYTTESFQDNFAAVTPSLDFDRVVVLTTGATASASELVINALKPYIDVVVIGERTSGKPFISTANNFCGNVLSAMEAQAVNANGVSVAGGIEPDCFAQDDPTRNFGGGGADVEGMLLSALDYVVFGSCDVEPVLASNPVVASKKEQAPFFMADERPVVGAVLDRNRARR